MISFTPIIGLPMIESHKNSSCYAGYAAKKESPVSQINEPVASLEILNYVTNYAGTKEATH